MADIHSPGFPGFADAGERIVDHIGGMGAHLLFSLGSHFSIWSLLAAFAVALVWLRLKRGRPLSLAFVRRALFPKTWANNRSTRLDATMLLLNAMVVPAMISWAIFSYTAIGEAITHGLTAATGHSALFAASPFVAKASLTLILFVAYEIAYFVDHWLSHNVEALWMFHRVHHTADRLTPLTNFRVHPIDSLVFANCIAIIGGTAAGMGAWVFGPEASPYALDGTNVLLFAFVCLLLHLQHSQLWIVLPGRWNRLIIGPAHHQLHHSRNPAHFNSNYGNSLALFDRLAGTLRLPETRSPRLKFGVAGLNHDPHSLHGALLAPFVDALALFGRETRQEHALRN